MIMGLLGGDYTNAYALLQRIYEALRRMGEAGRQALRRHSKPASDPIIRRRCFLAWYESFGEEAFGEVLPYLRSNMSLDQHTRWHAAEVVAESAMQANAREMIPLSNALDPIVRGNVIWGLVRNGVGGVSEICPSADKLVEDLHNTVFSGRDLHERAHAALLLGRFVARVAPDTISKDRLGQRLATLLWDKTSVWRGYVSRALCELGWRGAVPLLCRYVTDSRDSEIWLHYAVDAIEKLADVGHATIIAKASKGLSRSYEDLSFRLGLCAARLDAQT
jgi:hypothetical protein